MADSRTLSIILKLQDEFSKEIKNVEKGIQSAKPAFTKMAAVGTAAFAGISAGVGVAVKSAATFEKSMSNVSTLLDTTQEDMKAMGDDVLKLAKDLPVPIDELTSSLYDIRSAGISAEEAMSTLEYSAKLATAGLGTTQEATDVMTSALNAFSAQGIDSSHTADVFFKAVKSGKTTISALAQGFGQVAPLASQVGVHFEDLLATTAAMTTSGLDASVAYTQIRTALSAMLKPTKEMDDAMGSLGISSENLSDWIDEQGLTGIIRKLTEAVHGDKSELAKMFGSVEALNAVMMLNNETGDNAVQIYKDMKLGSEQLNEAFEKQKETFEAQSQIMQNNFEALKIQLGSEFMPLLNDVFEKIKPIVEKVTEWIQQNPELTKQIIIVSGAVALLVAGLGFLGLAIAAITPVLGVIAMLFSPIGLAIMAVIGIIYGLYVAWEKNFLGIRDIVYGYVLWFQEQWDSWGKHTYESTKAFLKMIWNILKSIFDGMTDTIGIFILIFTGRWDALGQFLRDSAKRQLDNVVQIFSNAWTSIKEGVLGVYYYFTGKFSEMWEKAKDIAEKIRHAISSAFDKDKKGSPSIADRVREMTNFASGELKTFSNAVPAIATDTRHNIADAFAGGRGGGGSSVTVYVTGNTLLDSQAAEKIGDMIIRRVKLNYQQ